MSPSRQALRCSSVLALAVCVLAQLAGSVHSAAVRHVACVEHGGVVELHASEGRDLGRKVPHATIAASDEEAHHAHCDLGTTPRGRAAAIARAFVGITSSQAPVVCSSLRAAASDLARFRLAPKGSPPADLPTV